MLYSKITSLKHVMLVPTAVKAFDFISSANRVDFVAFVVRVEGKTMAVEIFLL